MTTKYDVMGSKSTKDHLKKMEKALKKTQDPLLKAHVNQLRKAWGKKSRFSKAA